MRFSDFIRSNSPEKELIMRQVIDAACTRQYSEMAKAIDDAFTHGRGYMTSDGKHVPVDKVELKITCC